MRTLLLAWGALSLIVGCRADPLGMPCTADSECGPGYDCYRQVCVQVCTSDAECPDAERCERYHCVGRVAPSTGRAPADSRRLPGPGPATRAPVPALPDATGVELRAIRRELELIRQDQKKILERLPMPERDASPQRQ